MSRAVTGSSPPTAATYEMASTVIARRDSSAPVTASRTATSSGPRMAMTASVTGTTIWRTPSMPVSMPTDAGGGARSPCWVRNALRSKVAIVPVAAIPTSSRLALGIEGEAGHLVRRVPAWPPSPPTPRPGPRSGELPSEVNTMDAGQPK